MKNKRKILLYSFIIIFLIIILTYSIVLPAYNNYQVSKYLDNTKENLSIEKTNSNLKTTTLTITKHGKLNETEETPPITPNMTDEIYFYNNPFLQTTTNTPDAFILINKSIFPEKIIQKKNTLKLINEKKLSNISKKTLKYNIKIKNRLIESKNQTVKRRYDNITVIVLKNYSNYNYKKYEQNSSNKFINKIDKSDIIKSKNLKIKK